MRVLDNNSTLQMDLRAATTHPATLDLLDDELVGDMARVGLVAPIFQFWDRTSQALVATRFSKTTRGIRSSCNVNSSRLPSSSWTGCIPNVEVLFDHEVIDVAQSADAVTVQVRGPSGVISQHSAFI